MTGALSASDGSAYFYLGILADIPVANVLHIILSFAPGFYSPGTDHNLGYPLIFRSTVEISFPVARSFRLGKRDDMSTASWPCRTRASRHCRSP